MAVFLLGPPVLETRIRVPDSFSVYFSRGTESPPKKNW